MAPTGGKASYNGNEVTLSWTGIKTPDAINSTYLQNYFNDNYAAFATKYYEKRIEYNNSYIGKQGYEVYMQNEDGSLKELTFTENASYKQTIEGGKSYKFIIKSSYSIFKANQSDGLIINVNTKTDTTIDDIINQDKDKDKDKDTGLN